MKVLHCMAHLIKVELGGVLVQQLLANNAIQQIAPAHELQHHVNRVRLVDYVVHANNTRMGQILHDFGLIQHPFGITEISARSRPR